MSSIYEEYAVFRVRPKEMAVMRGEFPDAVGTPACWSDGGQLFPKPADYLSMRCWVKRVYNQPLPNPELRPLWFKMSCEPYPIEAPLRTHEEIVEVYAVREDSDPSQSIVSAIRASARGG